MLRRKINPKSGKEEYCLVSRKDPSKILKWFGKARPSDDAIAKEERRVEFFKHKR
jgi:hypothetical protein